MRTIAYSSMVLGKFDLVRQVGDMAVSDSQLNRHMEEFESEMPPALPVNVS